MLIQHPLGMSHNAISLSLCFDQDKIYVVSPSQNIFPLCQDRCAVLQDILIHKYSLIYHSDHLPHLCTVLYVHTQTKATEKCKKYCVVERKMKINDYGELSTAVGPPTMGEDHAAH